jgi:hypothetical protein
MSGQTGSEGRDHPMRIRVIEPSKREQRKLGVGPWLNMMDPETRTIILAACCRSKPLLRELLKEEREATVVVSGL